MKRSKAEGSFAEKQLTTLRSYAQWRILKDMVSSAKKKALHDKEYLIMIVDSQSLKVFSSCCKFYELY